MNLCFGMKTKPFTFVLALTATFLYIATLLYIKHSAMDRGVSVNNDSTDTLKKLSCRHVYLDLGCNKGVQVRKLFQPWLYPGAAIIPYFYKVFGGVAKRRRDVCAFGFEANPRHMDRLNYISRAFRDKGLAVMFYNYAISNTSKGTVTIYSETNFDVDWGAGILDVAIQDKQNMTQYAVPNIDIVQFMKEKIIPLSPEKIFMKMDIEGSEFLVLPHMLRSGMFCKNVITSMVIEVHDWAASKMRSRLTLNNFQKQIEAQKCVPSEIVPVDDESYNEDVYVDPSW